MRRTKIVATLGPASGSPGVIGSLLDAGADMVRLGLAHGTVDEHLAAIDLVRAAARARGREVGVLADLPGPKVRTGPFPEGGAFLAEGDPVTLAPGDGESDSRHIRIDEPRLPDIAVPGATIVLGDGTVTLLVIEVDGDLVAHPGRERRPPPGPARRPPAVRSLAAVGAHRRRPAAHRLGRPPRRLGGGVVRAHPRGAREGAGRAAAPMARVSWPRSRRVPRWPTSTGCSRWPTA